MRTPDKDIKNQDDESNDTAASAVVPWGHSGRADGVGGGWGCEGKRGQPELEERDDCCRHHLGDSIVGHYCYRVYVWCC